MSDQPPIVGTPDRPTVYGALRAADHPLTRAELAAITRRDGGQVGAALCVLVEQDRATISGRGWTLTAMERRRG